MKKIISLLSAVLILSLSASAFDGGGKKKNKKKDKEPTSCCSKEVSVTDAKKEGASCHAEGAKAEASAKNEVKTEGKSCCSKDAKKS